MKPFYFNIETTPLMHNPQSKELGGASVSMWVFDETLTGATDKAVHFIKECGWAAVKIDCALQPQAKQIAALDQEESANYQLAELYGISAHFDAWPKDGPYGADADSASEKCVSRNKE